MSRQILPSLRRCGAAIDQNGHTLVELLFVLVLLGLCLAGGGVALSHGITAVEARGAAQAWQAAGAWAQVAAVWQGAPRDVRYALGRLAVSSDGEASGADFGAFAPSVPVLANVVRWQEGEGVAVRFLATSAYPNSAGSLYFQAPGADYRVTVRLESGLTTRARVEAAP